MLRATSCLTSLEVCIALLSARGDCLTATADCAFVDFAADCCS